MGHPGAGLLLASVKQKMLTLVDGAVMEKILEREEDEYDYHSGKNESAFLCIFHKLKE